jgi:hypothetical protein
MEWDEGVKICELRPSRTGTSIAQGGLGNTVLAMTVGSKTTLPERQWVASGSVMFQGVIAPLPVELP